MLDFLSSSFLGESVSKFVHETGFAQLFLQEGGYKYLIMIAVGCFFLYLAIKHKFEPMLLVPIGFGIIIGNIPMVTGHGIGIYEEGSPKEIFERPQKPNTIKFIKRLTSLTYRIETVDYDFTEAYDELQQYAEKLLIENERISDLQIALEEIVVNNIMENTDAPQVLVRVDYSEKLDLLTLSIRYQVDHHDPKDSDNELFLEMLEEPTTELIDQIIEPAYGIYNNLIQINFKWEEAQ